MYIWPYSRTPYVGVLLYLFGGRGRSTDAQKLKIA